MTLPNLWQLGELLHKAVDVVPAFAFDNHSEIKIRKCNDQDGNDLVTKLCSKPPVMIMLSPTISGIPHAPLPECSNSNTPSP